MASLFVESRNVFTWKNIKPFSVRNQYNQLLNLVVNEYYSRQYVTNIPNFLNKNYCLTLANFEKDCGCGSHYLGNSSSGTTTRAKTLAFDDKNLENLKAVFAIHDRNLNLAYKNIVLGNTMRNSTEDDELAKLVEAIKLRQHVTRVYNAVSTAVKSNAPLFAELEKLKEPVKAYEESYRKYETERIKLANKGNEIMLADAALQVEYENALSQYEIAQRDFDFNPNPDNQKSQEEFKKKFEEVESRYKKNNSSQAITYPVQQCIDAEGTEFCLPVFNYQRQASLSTVPPDSGFLLSDLNFATGGLSVGAVIWLYFYERMGIFKILGVLMDDYNYRGKYTISGSRADKNGNANSYSTLMDLICTFYRAGVGSNLRDRICTYERVLGVTIENNMGIECVQNTGFMQTFNRLINYMLEYYKTKQLAQAIQSQNGSTQPRSSVATQTSIRDTMNLLKQQFEPIEYGRNQTNTFLGIATVHATLCLVNLLRKEIGIPDQYENPEEFIPAAYDILVAKKTPTLNETNRYIVHDNCASYGYRLLTDIEKANLGAFSIVASGSNLDIWLNDIEGVVEGYHNAYKSILEPASAMV
jgi:hypothetical protein